MRTTEGTCGWMNPKAKYWGGDRAHKDGAYDYYYYRYDYLAKLAVYLSALLSSAPIVAETVTVSPVSPSVFLLDPLCLCTG